MLEELLRDQVNVSGPWEALRRQSPSPAQSICNLTSYLFAGCASFDFD